MHYKRWTEEAEEEVKEETVSIAKMLEKESVAMPN